MQDRSDARYWDIDKARLLGIIDRLHSVIDGLTEANRKLTETNQELTQVNKDLIRSIATVKASEAPPIAPRPESRQDVA